LKGDVYFANAAQLQVRTEEQKLSFFVSLPVVALLLLVVFLLKGRVAGASAVALV
jgi:hypothetical protein